MRDANGRGAPASAGARARRAVARLLACLALAVASSARADTPSPTDAKALETLTGSRTVEAMVLHWDPRELKPDEVEAAEKRVRGFFAEASKALALTPPVPVHVYLYRDVAQLLRITGAEAGVAAFSGGHSVHQTHDYDDCHEFVHVFAQHLPTDAESVPPEGFFVEGLATALQKEDQGVPISTWAAVAGRFGRLPSLVALRRAWPQGAPPGVHPYHAAGSFLDFVIQTFGLERTRRLYTHCLEFQGVLGKSFAAVETEWRAWLAARAVPDDHLRHVLKAMGIGEHLVLPAALRARKGTRLFDGRSLAGWTPEADGVWSVRDGVLVGRNEGSWSHLRHPAPKGRWAGIRTRFRMLRGDAFKARTRESPAGANEAIFAAWKTFFGLQGASSFVGAIGQSDWRFTPGVWHDAFLLTEGGAGRIYVDGLLAVDAQGAVTQDGGFALGVERGEVEISSVEAVPEE